MIREKLAQLILKKNNQLNLKPILKNGLKYRDTIKSTLLDIGSNIEVSFPRSSDFSIEIPVDDYSLSLSADFYFGKKRIDEQVKNISNLLSTNSQPAWIIISTYYACFYLANELAKFYGIYIINFESNQLDNLFLFSKEERPADFNVESTNNSYKVNVFQSDSQNYIKLLFVKRSPKPHQEVWVNMSDIFSKLSKVSEDANFTQHFSLFFNIAKGINGWSKPSTIRNEWNYAQPYYFEKKGTDLAKTFIHCINNNNKAIAWANKRHLSNHPENIVASIAYVYHVLKDTIEVIHNRISDV